MVFFVRGTSTKSLMLRTGQRAVVIASVLAMPGFVGSTSAQSPVPGVDVSLQVEATILGQATWYRGGGDWECGGGRPASEDKSMGTKGLLQNISLHADWSHNQAEASDRAELSYTWHGNSSFVARRTSAVVRLTAVDDTRTLTVALTDFLNQQPANFDCCKNCGHIAGSMKLASDRLRGKLTITISAPPQPRAMSLLFASRTGSFRRAAFRANGVLHPLTRVPAEDFVVWPRAGEPSTIDFEFDDAFGEYQAGASGANLVLEIKPLGQHVPTSADLKQTLDSLPRRDSVTTSTSRDVVKAIDVLLGAVSSGDAVTQILRTNTWESLLELTDALFSFEVWPLPGTAQVTRDLKVAARLFGFSIGKQLLPDMLKSCETVQVAWPGSPGMASSRLVVVDTVLLQAEQILMEYPLREQKDSPELRSSLKSFYTKYSDGLAIASTAMEDAVNLSHTLVLARSLDEARSRVAIVARLDRELRAALISDSASARAFSNATLSAVVEARQVAVSALATVRNVIGVTSLAPTAFSIKLFTTDAHLVRLAVGAIEPYLAVVRDAYLAPGDLDKEFAAVDRCIKSGS